MLETRLKPIAEKWGYPTLGAMSMALRLVPDRNMVADVVEAMTFQETSFFRDQHIFDFIGEALLPAITRHKKGKKPIRIWSAGCSTGQEAYSVALTAAQKKDALKGRIVEIIGTDISRSALDVARHATYSQFDAQNGLSIRMQMDYFDQIGENWRLKTDIRQHVSFHYHNLLDPADGGGVFDIILCRYVLCNFDPAVRQETLDRMAENLAPEGVLILGSDERVQDESAQSDNKYYTALPGLDGVYVASSHPYADKLSPAKIAQSA